MEKTPNRQPENLYYMLSVYISLFAFNIIRSEKLMSCQETLTLTLQQWLVRSLLGQTALAPSTRDTGRHQSKDALGLSLKLCLQVPIATSDARTAGHQGPVATRTCTTTGRCSSPGTRRTSGRRPASPCPSLGASCPCP